MIHNSLKYVGSKNQKVFIQDLKEVYQASSLSVAKSSLDRLNENWGEIYPLAVMPWINRWDQVSNMPNDDALLKLLFIAGRDIKKNWTMPIPNWSSILTQLHIFFKEQIMVQ